MSDRIQEDYLITKWFAVAVNMSRYCYFYFSYLIFVWLLHISIFPFTCSAALSKQSHTYENQESNRIFCSCWDYEVRTGCFRYFCLDYRWGWYGLGARCGRNLTTSPLLAPGWFHLMFETSFLHLIRQNVGCQLPMISWCHCFCKLYLARRRLPAFHPSHTLWPELLSSYRNRPNTSDRSR